MNFAPKLHNPCLHNSFISCFFFSIHQTFNLRAGGEDSAFSNSSIIQQLREQVSQLQAMLCEKEETEKTASQKLAMYQNQLHAKNSEVATLKDQLQAQVCPKTNVIKLTSSYTSIHYTSLTVVLNIIFWNWKLPFLVCFRESCN